MLLLARQVGAAKAPFFFLTRSRSREEKIVRIRLFGTARPSLGGREVRRRDLPADEVVRVARHAR